MKKHLFLPAILVCCTTMYAQRNEINLRSNPKQYFLQQQSLTGKYPGSIYARWDTAGKKYRWFSPQKGELKNMLIPQKKGPDNASNFSGGDAQRVRLTKDINTMKDGNSQNYEPSSFYMHYAVLDGVSYFSANDGIHGTELWRSDGTEAGTYLVKDIDPGENASNISSITAVNGKIYFAAFTSTSGVPQPWVSDGTAAGTKQLADLTGYIFYSAPEQFTLVGGKVLFFAEGNHIWETDGTEAGTAQLYYSSDHYFSQPMVAGDKLFFVAFSYISYTTELWATDGTATGTGLIKAYPNDFEGLFQLTGLNDKLYFTSNDGTGRKLWVSDGTETGTTLAPNTNDVLVTNSGYYYVPRPFAKSNHSLYFAGTDAANAYGNELYKYNPDDPSGAVLVKDITPGTGNTNIDPYEITAFSDEGIAFRIFNADGTEKSLWRSNGASAGTKEVKTFTGEEDFYMLYNGGGTLYMLVFTDDNGYELWKSNGSPNGTGIVKDIFPGPSSAYPNFVTYTPTGILFGAREPKHGFELWKTDGTSAGTRIVKNINQITTSSSTSAYQMASTENGVVFGAFDILHESEPHFSDGTTKGTKLIKDILPGDLGSFPYGIKTVNGITYFTAYDQYENYIYSSGLYKYDNKTGDVKKLFATPANYRLDYIFDVADNGLVFFEMLNINTFQYEIWRTDGTATGTFMLAAGVDPYAYVFCVGNTCYFAYHDENYDEELWKSNGTLAGTKRVKDINATGPSYPFSFYKWGNELYFGANDGTTIGFWKTNGTENGTIKLSGVSPAGYNPWIYFYPNKFYCAAGNILYFAGYLQGIGTELWKTDGTSAGTVLVKDIDDSYADASSSPDLLNNLDGTVYFKVTDAITYRVKLWKSDGSESGTQMVKDFSTLPGNNFMDEMVAAGGKLFFVLDDQLWGSNGKAEGTKPVADPGVDGLSSIIYLVPTGDNTKLFFHAYTYHTGGELYVGYLCNDTAPSFAAVSSAPENIKNGEFSVTVSPNPVQSDALLYLKGDIKDADITITNISGKTLWRLQHVNVSSISLPFASWPSGTYFVKVRNRSKLQTLKLVKQ